MFLRAGVARASRAAPAGFPPAWRGLPAPRLPRRLGAVTSDPRVALVPETPVGFDKSNPLPGAAPLGLMLLLISLGILFISSLVGFWFVRASVAADVTWPPPGMPPLPRGMWVATALLLVVSGSLHLALVAARRGERGRLVALLGLSLLLGTAFMVLQGLNWHAFIQPLGEARIAGDQAGQRWFGQFFVLTVLHGLHVVGGLIPLGVTWHRSRDGRYGPGRSTGVLLCAMYWHFLDVVWLVVFGTLLFA